MFGMVEKSKDGSDGRDYWMENADYFVWYERREDGKKSRMETTKKKKKKVVAPTNFNLFKCESKTKPYLIITKIIIFSFKV